MIQYSFLLKMKLVKPTLKYKQSYQSALNEFEKEGLKREWVFLSQKSIADYVQLTKENEKGINLPFNWVPATTYWLIDKEKFIGHVNIRHKLNDRLKVLGGNIGYFIRPTERRKGYGKKILELALPKSKELGIKKVLITCDDDNIGSAKIIEFNGGILQDKKKVEGILIRRYWIIISS